MTKFTKSLIASAIGAAVASPAAFAGAVWFDVNGAAGANAVGTDRFLISSFDWNVGNVLATNSTSNHDPDNPVTTRILAQAPLSVINLSSGNTFSYGASGELTYQMSVRANVGVDTSTDANGVVTWSDAGSTDDNYFDIYFDSTPDTGGTSGTSGCGFGEHSTGVGGCAADDGVRILRGRVELISMNWDANDTQSTPLGLLDQFGIDNQNNTRTIAAQGNGTFGIEIISFDPAFFFMGGLADEIGFDIDFSNANPDPFNSANPTDVVVDVNVASDAAARAASYGTDGINNVGAKPTACPGAGSGGADGICDLHMQGDSNSDFNATPTPEPATLALIGAGLLGAGLARRRKV